MASPERMQYDKLVEAQGHLQNLRLELDTLVKLGDMVTPDDVMKSASALVGKGFTPQEMAAMLADMPEASGEALQQWIAMHDQSVSEMEARAHQMVSTARHGMGVAAMHRVMGDHLEQQQGVASPVTASPLAPTGGQPATTPLSPMSPTQGSA